jgi:16S rRNA (cytidine1402-2'-O)-methyltransferase
MADLYLIPTTLGDSALEKVLPSENTTVIKNIRHYMVEDIRTARRFLKKVDRNINIEELTFFELNEHTDLKQIEEYFQPLLDGSSMGIISEAGCPGVADPGAEAVRVAHEKGIRVIPLVGPSSILLSLMASGMNGQNFLFHGYLPVKPADRIKAIKDLEKRSGLEKQTQIFIETPYRNLNLFKDLVSNLHPQTRLCITADLTLESEYIKTLTVQNWKKQSPDINKKPAIFLIYKD